MSAATTGSRPAKGARRGTFTVRGLQATPIATDGTFTFEATGTGPFDTQGNPTGNVSVTYNLNGRGLRREPLIPNAVAFQLRNQAVAVTDLNTVVGQAFQHAQCR